MTGNIQESHGNKLRPGKKITPARSKRAVIFDMDGVVVQTEALKAEAHEYAIHALGGNIQRDAYSYVIGRSHEEIRSFFLRSAGIQADPLAYSRLYKEHYHLLLVSNVQATPGIESLLQILIEKGYAVGLASSSSGDSIRMILEKIGFSSYFSVLVSSDDVVHKKPAPDCYLMAIQKLSVHPHQVAAFEDTTPGIQAAKLAGLKVFAVRHSYNYRQDLSEAVKVFRSLLDTQEILQAVDQILS